MDASRSWRVEPLEAILRAWTHFDQYPATFWLNTRERRSWVGRIGDYDLMNYDKTCARCELPFQTETKVRKYCSVECRDEQQKANSAGDRWILFDRDGCRCIYCGTTAAIAELSPDHIIPASKGGPHTAGNLVTACRQCNTARIHKDLSPETLKFVTETVDARNEACGIPGDKPIKGMHCR